MTEFRTVQISLEILIGMSCLMAALVMRITQQSKRSQAKALGDFLICVAILQIVDCGAWIFRGNESEGGYIAVRVLNMAEHIINYVTGYFLYRYARVSLKRQGVEISIFIDRAMKILVGLGITVTLLSQIFHFLYYFDDDNRYVRGQYYWIAYVIGFLIFLLMYLIVFIYRLYISNITIIASGICLTVPVIATIVQMRNHGFPLQQIAYGMGGMILFFIYEAMQGAVMREQGIKLQNAQIELLWSQIKPHFMYNTLNSIYVLVDRDPERAKKAISDFSDYLRNVLERSYSDATVPFAKEFGLIKNYLNLEKMRYTDKLDIEYDIQTSDFRVPSLSLQPLVENAVKHGVSKKKDGGRIIIRTSKKGNKNVFEVIDDGVGFDIAEYTDREDNDMKHIGISNVKNRVWDVSRAKMEIESTVGKGTRVSIEFPK